VIFPKAHIIFIRFGALFLSFVLNISFTFIIFCLVSIKRNETKEAAVVDWFKWQLFALSSSDWFGFKSF